MKSKKRNLFLILAACCLGVGAVTFSNLNPIGAMHADNITYGMTFNSSKNKFHNYSGTTPYSGEATVKTNLNNNVNFEYKDLMGLTNTWHVVKSGGYFTNLDPINGLETINIRFKSNYVPYKIYWSYTTTFDDTNVYTGTSSTSSPLNFNFNSNFPTYFKLENVSNANLNIFEVNFEFTCLNAKPTINVSSNDDSLGAVSGGGTYTYGEKVTLLSTPNEYCEFIGWYVNDNLLSKDKQYSFIVEQDMNIIGVFAKTLYYVTVEVNNQSMGQVSGAGAYTYGEQVTLVAFPEAKHTFIGWYKDNILISEDFKLEFTIFDYNVTYEAVFAEAATINITNENPDLGNITGAGTFAIGTTVRLTATPNISCEFLGWYEDDILLSKDLNFDLLVTNDVHLSVKFAKKTYFVTTSINDDHMGTVSGAGSYVYGEQVDLIAIPKSGYSFFGWYNGDNLISQDSTLSFLMEDYDIHYEARFVKSYKIIIVNDFEEMGYVESASECGVGLTTSVKAIPKNGYKLSYWCDEDLNILSQSNPYYFTMPEKDVVLYPIFEPLPRLSVINYNYNYVKIIGEGYYCEGESVELFAQFSKGNFMGWYANNELVSLDNPYKFTMPDNDLQLEARWHNFTISNNSITYCPKDIKFAYIPDSVTSIGSTAFYNCSSLISVIIPDSVTSIGREAFYGCSSLENIYYTGTVEDWCESSVVSSNGLSGNPMQYAEHFYMLNESNEWYEVSEIVVPDTVTKIGDYQFQGFDYITSIHIPDSVTSIGYAAFRNCTSLTSVTIGNSVTSIGSTAFYNCTSLISVIIPDSVTSIGNGVFCNCSSLTSITLPFIGDGTSSNPHLGYLFGTSEYSENNKYVPSSLKEVIISDACAFIRGFAFYKCEYITSIRIGASVTSIGRGAFYNCPRLTNVYYTGTIEDWCNISFYNYESNPMYYADNFYMLNESNEWYKVTEIVVPDTVTKIGDYQFQGFYYITSIHIPDSVTSIGNDAFSYCSSLTSIIIPDSVTSIGDEAFSFCTSLENIDFGGTTVAWGKISFGQAWRYYSNLKTITCSDGIIHL